MNKGRIIKTVVATSALVVLTSMTVFGKIITKSEKLGSGIMYLSGDTASSLKKLRRERNHRLEVVNLH